MRTNLHHLLEESALRSPAAAAVTYKDETRTYEQLWRGASLLALALRERGLRRDDRVAIYLDKRIETVESIFGISAASGVFVPVNHILKPSQVSYILSDCDVRVLITSSERLSLLQQELVVCPSLEHVILVDEGAVADDPPGSRYAVHRWTDLESSALTADQPSLPGVDLDMAAIFYTSGSTGKPKGVVLSHRNLLVGAESVSSYLGNTRDDVILSALPLSFDAGFSQLTTAVAVGAHLVLMNYLVPGDVLRLCVKHRVTGLTCVPPLWIQLADLAWPAEVAASLRYFANTGGRMPKATLDKLRSHFPTSLPFLMYGLTEAFRSTYLDPAEVDARPDSIGKAIPNAEILVARPDGSLCDPGEEGELVHRGPLVALGYWNDPVRTAERFRPVPGPLPTWRPPEMAVWSGDAVVADAEGFLYFVGRKDDMIKTSGYRVSPTEIEEVAYDTGLVRDAVALGVEDPRLGMRIVVLATPSNGASLDPKNLMSAMRKLLPAYMVPSTVLVRDQLPRSANGKFDRVLLKKEANS